MVNVYYSFSNSRHINPFPDAVWQDPVLVLKEVAENYKSFPQFQRLMRCPSFRDSLANTFVLKSPITFDLRWNEASKLEQHWRADNGGKLFSDGLYPHIELFTDNQPIFIADKPVTMKVLPPSMHEDAPRYPFLGGQFDIHKWYRPVHPTFLMHRGDELSLKRGQALMYVQFDKRVRLKRFRYSEEFDSELEKIVEARKHIPIAKMQDLYDFFALSKRKRFLLNEVKKNIL